LVQQQQSPDALSFVQANFSFKRSLETTDRSMADVATFLENRFAVVEEPHLFTFVDCFDYFIN